MPPKNQFAIVLGTILLTPGPMVGQNVVPPPPEKPPEWETSAALGLTVTSGNSDTMLFTGNVRSSKKSMPHEFDLGADVTYGEIEEVKNAESFRAFGQYNRLFNERLFGYTRLEGLHDDIADVEYRFTLSPGVGYYFIKNATTFLRGETGPGFVYEKQGGRTDEYFTLRFAERFEHKFSDTVKIWQGVEFLPQIDDWNNFILNAENRCGRSAEQKTKPAYVAAGYLR